MKDLAPDIYRQRLVIEGYPTTTITDVQIKDYLAQLADVLDMKTILAPITHKSSMFGWAGWIHWETSGAHFYAWDNPRLFFSVDIYTCKPFDAATATDFTKRYFEAGEIVSRAF